MSFHIEHSILKEVVAEEETETVETEEPIDLETIFPEFSDRNAVPSAGRVTTLKNETFTLVDVDGETEIGKLRMLLLLFFVIAAEGSDPEQS